jgi:hypothetical protein
MSSATEPATSRWITAADIWPLQTTSSSSMPHWGLSTTNASAPAHPTCAWIARGRSKPFLRRMSSTLLLMPVCVQARMGRGGSLPRTCS